MQTLENRREEARAYSNLGSAYHSQRDFDKAVSYHTRVLELAQELGDRAIEMRAYAGLGHAARCMQVGVTSKWIRHSGKPPDGRARCPVTSRTWRERISTTSTSWTSLRSSRTERRRAAPLPTWVGLPGKQVTTEKRARRRSEGKKESPWHNYESVHQMSCCLVT